MIAYVSVDRRQEECSYSTMKAIPEYMNRHYPFYGLLFVMNEYYIEKEKMRYVSDGARSVSEHSNIQPFLMEKFGFRKAYCQVAIYYVWWLRCLITVLYPFRRWIPFLKVKHLLNFEAVSRGDELL